MYFTTLITHALTLTKHPNSRPNNTKIFAKPKLFFTPEIKVGDIVSFNVVSKNKEKIHVITQVRPDLTWQNVVNNYYYNNVNNKICTT